VARSNTRDDFVCFFADPNEVSLTCRYGMQRRAGGSSTLRPEESTSTSFGVVVEPIENMTVTLDFWEIEKTNTIGLFGEENHTALDLLLRLRAGAGSCGSVVGNPLVIREDPSTLDPAEQQLYLDAGICPVGDVTQVDDTYANLDTRTVRGYDLGFYYDFDTAIGNFDIRYVASFLDKFEQKAGGAAAELIAAQANGELPANVPVVGFADLVRQDGNADEKHTLRLTWRKGDWGAAMSAVRLGDFIQTSLTLEDPVTLAPIYYVIPTMTTYNVSADYRMGEIMGVDTRIRLGIQNLTDERAPLADDSFGYFADMHRDLGISYYVDVRLSF
jgi:outer membrane receptor protein involved in Fe transport